MELRVNPTSPSSQKNFSVEELKTRSSDNKTFVVKQKSEKIEGEISFLKHNGNYIEATQEAIKLLEERGFDIKFDQEELKLLKRNKRLKNLSAICYAMAEAEEEVAIPFQKSFYTKNPSDVVKGLSKKEFGVGIYEVLAITLKNPNFFEEKDVVCVGNFLKEKSIFPLMEFQKDKKIVISFPVTVTYSDDRITPTLFVPEK